MYLKESSYHFQTNEPANVLKLMLQRFLNKNYDSYIKKYFIIEWFLDVINTSDY